MLRARVAVVTVGLAAIWASTARAAPADVQPPPNLPAALRAPAGAKPIARLQATGAQIYKCAAADGKYAWSLQRPDATLRDGAGAVVGTHGAGPSWTASDGSSVVGAKLMQAPAPAASAVPWLLLRATANSGSGRFSAVTFVQRVDTKGGIAPQEGCDASHLGAETRASYSAAYYFYTGGEPSKKTKEP